MFEKLKNFINNATVVTNGYETVKSKYGEMYVHEPTKKGLERKYDFRRKIIVNREEDKMGKINKMPDVAKMLGKELEEEFMIKDNPYSALKYKLTYAGLKHYSNCRWSLCKLATLQELLVGELEIEWIPKDMEKVWIVYSDFKRPVNVMFNGDSYHHKLLFKRELITKTEQEAIQNMRDRGWLY